MFVLERILDHSRESESNAPLGCLGELYKDGVFYCYTIEQPYRDNRPFVSSVPVGEYDLKSFDSNKYGRVVALVNHDLNVYANKSEATEDGDRYACLVHAANWSHQLQGCIAPGKNIAWGKHKNFKPNIMVTNSKNTLASVLPQMIDEKLLIRWKH